MASREEALSDLNSTLSSDILDDINSLHSATATTDYSAFIGREESISSDDSLPPRSKPASRARAKKSRKVQKALSSSAKASDRPLRPAQDILARLRHDPALSSQNFSIGYLDRHAPDVMEMPLEKWNNGDVTDEEFIPQHRILWFRRNEDGVKVWDRRERIDMIFAGGSRTGDGVRPTGIHSEEACGFEKAEQFEIKDVKPAEIGAKSPPTKGTIVEA
ncbi:MAG: hypothetical protein HETSPECPRED_008907 [Heterodermia speciosa]|uniref:MJ1316 RNA cyclic group end recognition domain-containing protein n=1 Tax=Heterodermia speciosa TaxID=116794 RepID=A0A8H3IAN0_9LECA|nr:MAG: hypothetical protein HETSPECPRED_008907 [Heterodermia speciosa]